MMLTIDRKLGHSSFCLVCAVVSSMVFSFLCAKRQVQGKKYETHCDLNLCSARSFFHMSAPI